MSLVHIQQFQLDKEVSLVWPGVVWHDITRSWYELDDALQSYVDQSGVSCDL